MNSNLLKRFLLPPLALSMLIGCSDPMVPAVDTPAFAITPAQTGVVFCGTLKLDVYQPSLAFARPRPAFLGVHGGGFLGGTTKSDQILFAFQRAINKGAIAISIDYTVGLTSHDQNLRDVKCAVRWVRVHAAQLGIDPNKVVMFGHSAGADLAVRACLVPITTYGGAEWSQGFPDRPQACAGWAGPYDKLRLDELEANSAQELGIIFGADLVQASAPTWVSADDPPIFLVHGTSDPSINWAQSARLDSLLTLSGVRHTFLKQICGSHYMQKKAGSTCTPSPSYEGVRAFTVDSLLKVVGS